MALLSFLRKKLEPAAAPDAPAKQESLFESFGHSDGGPHRAVNEDRYALFDDSGLWVVADGMGGHREGGRAAQMVVDAVAAAATSSDPNAIETALQGVNKNLFEKSQTDGVSGATVAVLKVDGAASFCLWAGDCRIYRWRSGELEQLTSDHSEVNRMVAAGLISRHEAADHPMRHIVTRAVGPYERVEVDRREDKVMPGDLFLLCTDGLIEGMDDVAIGALLCAHGPSGVNELVQTAVDSGASDNVTAAIIRCS